MARRIRDSATMRWDNPGMRGSGGGDARSGLLRNDEPRLFLGEGEVCAACSCGGLYGRVAVICMGGRAMFVAEILSAGKSCRMHGRAQWCVWRRVCLLSE